MPLVTFNHDRLAIDLPDLVKGATVMKRKAVNIRLVYDIDPKFISIKWIEKKFCKNEDGTFGDLEGQTGKVLTAKDYIYVDVTDGTQLCRQDEETIYEYSEPDEDGNREVTASYLNPVLENKEYAIETDYYDHIGNAVPVIVNNIISARVLRDYEQA